MEASSNYTTLETLTEALRAVEPRIPEMGCRVFPSSFDPKDKNMRAFPRRINWQWVSCEQPLRFFNARAVMTRVPHFWQLESPVHACCRSVGALIFTNEIENMPVGAAAVASANIDTVLSEASDSFAFTSFLLERDVPLPALWFLIHKIGTHGWAIPASLERDNINVVQEVHLSPGNPVLVQCPELARGKKPLFHLSDTYTSDTQGDSTFITSVGDDLFPLRRFLLPISIRTTGTCPCGEVIIERKLP